MEVRADSVRYYSYMVKSTEPPPTPAATYERALSMAKDAAFAVRLQCQRLQGQDLTTMWWDYQFLIIALNRLRQAVFLGQSVELISDQLAVSIDQFDSSLPMLKTMRNVGEHIEGYGLDKGHSKKKISRKSLQVGAFSNERLQWLGEVLETQTALSATRQLVDALRSAGKAFGEAPDLGLDHTHE